MRHLLAVAMLLCVAPFAQAQQKFVPGSVVEVPVGHAADLAVSPPEDGSVLFKITPAPIWKAGGLESRTIFNGVPGTIYTVDAQFFTYNATKKKVEVREESLTLTFKGVTPTPVTPPVPVDPVTPPTPKAFYFLVVRPDGPADPGFTRIMGDPAWQALKGRGHTVKDKTVTEAKALGVMVPTTPSVVTLVVAADGRSSSIYRAAVPLPTDSASILKLAEGGK